jgi:hypothetical protein
MTIVRRNRSKQNFCLKTRLIEAADASQSAALVASTEAERQELLKRARRYEVSTGFDAPGFPPPE